MLERLQTLNIPIYKIPLFANDFTKQYRNSLHNINLVAGVRELLIELNKRGYQLAIVSSNSENIIKDYLAQNQLEVVKTVLHSTNILNKDRVIKKVLSLHNFTVQEAIYVGDEFKDLKTCKRLGIKIIWADWGYDILEADTGDRPDYRVNSPQQILKILV